MHWAKFNDGCWDFRVENLNRLSVYESAELTINSIIDNYPPPYNLMVSGGIDSQAMLFLWNKFGKNFVPVSFTYNTDLNLYDILTLEQIKYPFNFDIKIVDFDILSFLQHEVNEYALRYRCSSPCINAHIKMSEYLKGTVIFAGDFIGEKFPLLSNAILGLYRASLCNPNIIPYFFLHTPELGYSLQRSLDKTLSLSRNSNDYDYQTKVEIYIKNGLMVSPQDNKTTGFEKIKDYYDEKYYNLVPKKDRIRFAAKHSKRTFDLLLRYPYELLFDKEPLKFKINTFG